MSNELTWVNAVVQPADRVLRLGRERENARVLSRRLAPGADPLRVALDAVRTEFGEEGELLRFLGVDEQDGAPVFTYLVRVRNRFCA